MKPKANNSGSFPKHQPVPSASAKSASAPSTPSTEVLSQVHTSLTPLLSILHAAAHRHRNQHSASHWWAAFTLLRRATRNLAAALVRRPRRPDHDIPAVAHAKWMTRHVVSRAYIAFTQLAADNQHAPLGLMLLAVLARINHLLSDLVPLGHNPNSVSAPDVPINLTSRPNPAVSSLARPDGDIDMGVAVSRDELALPRTSSRDPDRPGTRAPSSKELKTEKLAKAVTTTTKDAVKDKKKKKKGGDALSSIFGSL
ncbi:Ribonuclease MRP protein subunit rmp1 [Neonectria magnoliae]|uniref:Ribonuclease MRP protein subunit rmp1 n=1 Tax=Neonectria magnoliae TaxID=2732573 RepID=A0ABR1I9J4_9HYPO